MIPEKTLKENIAPLYLYFSCVCIAHLFSDGKKEEEEKRNKIKYTSEKQFLYRKGRVINQTTFCSLLRGQICSWEILFVRNFQICKYASGKYCKYANMLLRNTFRPKIASSQFIHESFPFPGWKFRFNTWLKRHKGKFLNIAERFWKCIQFL